MHRHNYIFLFYFGRQLKRLRSFHIVLKIKWKNWFMVNNSNNKIKIAKIILIGVQ